MRMSRTHTRLAVLALGAFALSSVVGQQGDGIEEVEEAEEAGQQASEQPQPQPQPEEVFDDDIGIEDDWEMPELPGGGGDDVFIPTEEIAADEEVTFPVNI